MCLFQVQHKLTSLHIPFYCFKGSFDRSLNVPVSPGCLVQRIFEDCICVSLFSYQGSHLFTVLRQLIYYITAVFVCQQLFYFFQVINSFFRQLVQIITSFFRCQLLFLLFFKTRERRRRDLNPRTAQTVYTLSRGTSSAT